MKHPQQPEPPFRPPRGFLASRKRRLLVFVVLAWLFMEFLGVPHLRVSYTYLQHGHVRHFQSARYLGPFGFRDAVPGELGRGCPVVVLIAWERPVSTRIRDWIQSKI